MFSAKEVLKLILESKLAKTILSKYIPKSWEDRYKEAIKLALKVQEYKLCEWQIKGKPYTIIFIPSKKAWFCSCRDFIMRHESRAKGKEEIEFCKHIIAVVLNAIEKSRSASSEKI